jgi:hypothetical protein
MSTAVVAALTVIGVLIAVALLYGAYRFRHGTDSGHSSPFDKWNDFYMGKLPQFYTRWSQAKGMRETTSTNDHDNAGGDLGKAALELVESPIHLDALHHDFTTPSHHQARVQEAAVSFTGTCTTRSDAIDQGPEVGSAAEMTYQGVYRSPSDGGDYYTYHSNPLLKAKVPEVAMAEQSVPVTGSDAASPTEENS